MSTMRIPLGSGAVRSVAQPGHQAVRRGSPIRPVDPSLRSRVHKTAMTWRIVDKFMEWGYSPSPNIGGWHACETRIASDRSTPLRGAARAFSRSLCHAGGTRGGPVGLRSIPHGAHDPADAPLRSVGRARFGVAGFACDQVDDSGHSTVTTTS